MTSYRTSMFIAAPCDAVFDHFVRPELLVRWMGDHARLQAEAGGVFSVDINGVLIRGRYVLVERPSLIVVSWGELGNGAMPPGSTRVEVRLTPEGEGTRLILEHSGLTDAEAQKHAVGWPHFLDRLSLAGAGRDPGPDPWATDASSAVTESR